MYQFNENFGSQLRAIIQLTKLGWKPICRSKIKELRDGNRKAVVLEPILREALQKINKIEHKGKVYDFTSEAISNAIFTLLNEPFDGLVRTNEKIFEYLLRGISVKQTIDGDSKSFSMQFIDFKNPENNAFNVAWEFDLEAVSSSARPNVRLDIVLFINGIPVVQIENKSSSVEAEKGCEQLCGYQQKDSIPYFYVYPQLLLATNKHAFLYGTVGTPKKLYAKWREKIFTEKDVLNAWQIPVLSSDFEEIFDESFTEFKNKSDDFISGNVQITDQDIGIHSLLSKDRLLDLMKNFIIFDGGDKKVCRYQQLFAIKNIEKRIENINAEGRREGGIIWHTQGSGKSLTMVMAASMILSHKAIKNPQIIIVTDRTDLDDQIKSTFKNCGFNEDELVQAKSGQHLIDILSENRTKIVTTLIQKFSNAINGRYKNISPNVFILIDESHRTQNGINHAQMKKAFSNACYIGFTGTPLMKKEKDTIKQFGGLIDKYTIDQAIEDGAVVRLLYEGRHVEQEVNQNAIDVWFERLCKDLNAQEKADLKRKFAKAGELQKTQQTIYCIAYDISEHFKKRWQGTGFKAQLVTPSKYAAILYKKYFDEIGDVKTEVVISAPDLREGDDEASERVFDDDAKAEVKKFWENQMSKHRNEKEYSDAIIRKFKSESDDVEILIVVDKLLTGFDAPRNRTLYITRNLEGHTLLQAIARVNRTYEGKEEGYIIDYANILQNLDKAITQYSSLADFEEEDLKAVLFSVREEIEKLDKVKSALRDTFDGLDIVRNTIEEYEDQLADEEKRKVFYSNVAGFSKALSISLSSDEFNSKTTEDQIAKYRQELRFFMKLRESAKVRYSDSIVYKEYEEKIRDLLNKHIGASEVLQVVTDVDIFNEAELSQALNEKNSDKAKADLILNNARKSIDIKLKDQDPILWKKFSKMINDVLEDAKSKRLSDIDYLLKARDIKEVIINKKDESIPEEIANEPEVHPFYRKLLEYIKNDRQLIDASRFIYKIISDRIIVDWKDNIALQNDIKNAIDDYFFDVIKLDKQETIDQICVDMIELAKNNF